MASIFVRIVKFLVGLVLLALFLLYLAAWLQPDPPAFISPQFTEAERRWVAERMKFHGITSARLDQATGERYFERDGRRCKL